MFAIFVLQTGRVIMTTSDASVAERIARGNPVLDWMLTGDGSDN